MARWRVYNWNKCHVSNVFIYSSMKNKLILSTFFAAFTFVASAVAGDFPEGSPKFGTNYKAALEQAKKENKPAILVFSAAWCGPCQAMKKKVYPSKEVAPLHDKFVWTYLDIDEGDNSAISEKYGVQGIPHIQFLDAAGKPIGTQVGSSDSAEFVRTLNAMLKKAQK